MKQITILSLLLFVLIGASGCSSNEEDVEQLSEFNFGKGEYEEPFVGILKSQPSILVKSLKYPPFSYLRPDTVVLRKDLVINFNEECLRSKSEAVISFVDKSYQAFEGVEIYCNGQLVVDNQYLVRAESPTEDLRVELKISPKLGKSTNLGYVVIKGNELDLVNKVAIQQDHNVVANISFKQTLGWPMMLWLSWLVAAIILIWISKFIIIAIIKLIRMIKTNIPNLPFVPNPFASIASESGEKLFKTIAKHIPGTERLFAELSKAQYIDGDFANKIIARDLGRGKGVQILCTKYPVSDIIIKGDTIYAKAGSTIDDGHMNEFLNHIMPNKTYVVDNHTIYKTDKLGRVTSVTSNRSTLSNSEIKRNKQRNSPTQSRVINELDGIEGDDGGHIIANNTGGANELINQVPMNRDINQHGRWRKFEKKEEKALSDRKSVISKRTLLYKGDSKRPYAIQCDNIINGVKQKREVIEI